MRLFGRTAKVTIVRQPSGFIGSNPQFFESTGNAIEVVTDELSTSAPGGNRIQFEVSKNLGKEPNKCSIKIYNLSPDTRSELEKNPIRITLAAGYDGVTRLLFTGDLRYAISERVGPNIITTLDVRDGMRAYAHARMNHSYKPPIRALQVLQDCARSLGLELPPEVERSADLRAALSDGISLHGPTRDILTRLIAPYGFGWSVQNGHLQILRDEEVRSGQAFLVNDDEGGLLNSPKKTVPDKPGSPPEISFDVQLYPELVPGALAKVESEFLNATVKMLDVKASGDTDPQGDWKTSVKGRPL